MKGLLNGLKAMGVLMIVGTAGAADCLMIDFKQAVCQVLFGLCAIIAAYLLPFLWKGLRAMAVMLFCVR